MKKSLARPQDKSELIARLGALRPDSARRWGRMSVHQAVCHVADAFRMAMGQKAVADRSNPLRRTVVKWIALYTPMPWPAGIPTSVEVDQERGGTPPCPEFARDLAEVLALLELFTAPA